MNTPVTPYVLVGRILSIIGMALTAALAILFALIPEWWWTLAMLAGFVPFFLLIVFVEKYSSRHGLIGPEPPTEAEQD